MVALRRLAPRMQVGGIIVLDDPSVTPALGGALLAMEEFLEDQDGLGTAFVRLLGVAQYALVRTTT